MTLVRVIVGSLRQGSNNRALARMIVERGHPDLSFAFTETGDLPLYNEDIEADPPAPVLRVREEIGAAKAVMFVTPEYNRSIPGALKNMIDWVSRPYAKNGWAGKVGAVIGTSPGPIGTAVGQQHLRLIVSPIGVAMLPRPEMYVIWRDGLLEEAEFGKRIDGFLEAFAGWIGKNG
jgi:chromate reductase